MRQVKIQLSPKVGDEERWLDEVEGKSLEGWVSSIGKDMTLEQMIDLAFDYRGDTTVVRTDGTEVEGYLFNREAGAPRPYIQVLDKAGNSPINIPYSEIDTIKFTGKDTARGRSWEAWAKRRDKVRAKHKASNSQSNP